MYVRAVVETVKTILRFRLKAANIRKAAPTYYACSYSSALWQNSKLTGYCASHGPVAIAEGKHALSPGNRKQGFSKYNFCFTFQLILKILGYDGKKILSKTFAFLLTPFLLEYFLKIIS